VRRSKEKGTEERLNPLVIPPPHSFLKNRELLDPAEQSAQAERQLPQILPLYKAN
jgi:hypothetical protein